MKSIRTFSIAIILFLASISALAQTAMTLNVDATDAARNLVHSKLTIPVRPDLLGEVIKSRARR